MAARVVFKRLSENSIQMQFPAKAEGCLFWDAGGDKGRPYKCRQSVHLNLTNSS